MEICILKSFFLQTGSHQWICKTEITTGSLGMRKRRAFRKQLFQIGNHIESLSLFCIRKYVDYELWDIPFQSCFCPRVNGLLGPDQQFSCGLTFKRHWALRLLGANDNYNASLQQHLPFMDRLHGGGFVQGLSYGANGKHPGPCLWPEGITLFRA